MSFLVNLALGLLFGIGLVLSGMADPASLGFRTAREIDQERYALKALRGDFDGVRDAESRWDAVLQAVGLRTRSRGGRSSGTEQGSDGQQ